MPRIKKPSPPEHIVIVDTNILWHREKHVVVCPEFDEFWDQYVSKFPMKLILPEVVRGELLYQQSTSAEKLLDRGNQCFGEIEKITGRKYSHRVDRDRIRKEVESRFSVWLHAKKAEVKATPISGIDWQNVIESSVWRVLPFTPDAKNADSEKGFRDRMILETVAAVCKFYADEVNIAFICNDYALREAAETRLGKIESFSTYESLDDFRSFIELTQKNLTERFVKSILHRARERFHKEKNRTGLIYDTELLSKIRAEFRSKIELPVSSEDVFSLITTNRGSWKHVGKEMIWVTRPQFDRLEKNNLYFWKSVITIVRLYERTSASLLVIGGKNERNLMILPIEVLWKSTVRADGRFYDCEVVEYKEGEYSFRTPKDGEINRYRVEVKSEQSEGEELDSRSGD